MATEKRLIDGNKAKDVLVNMAEHLLEHGNPEMAGAVGYAAEVIGNQKNVDAVEVVRCKSCKYYEDGGCLQTYLEYEPDPTDFCSYGEEKNGGVINGI